MTKEASFLNVSIRNPNYRGEADPPITPLEKQKLGFPIKNFGNDGGGWIPDY